VVTIDPKNFGCNISVRPSVRPPARADSGGGAGKSQDNPTGGGQCHLFLAGSRAVLLGNRVFLAGNRMTIVAFQKEVSLRVFDSTVVLYLRKKHLISINGKKKFKRILVEGEKFKLRKLPSKYFVALFSSRRRA